MLQQKHSKAGVLSTFIVCLFLVITSVLLIVNKQRVIDQLTVWQYHPTSEVISLADRAGMSGYGKFLYLASQPTLDATQNFNTECDRVEKVTSILGCYRDYKIYLYDVTDPQLDGIREVTATHETLHAAYIRMDDNEKTNVDALLDVEYKKLETNKNFADLMSFYDRTEPGQRDNELHSIIGTEVAEISPELESHYKQYFSDRQKVVALNASYSSVFQKLETRANELTTQINALSRSISDRSTQYNADINVFNSDKESIKTRLNNNEFSSQEQLNKETANLNSRVPVLNSTLASIKADIANYESLLAELNSIASQSKKLNNSIDSTLAPAPSV
jgi:prefoldin subunit 5